jgi:hypothetical protein
MYYTINSSPFLSSERTSLPRRTTHKYDLLQFVHHFHYVKELAGKLP